jgi:hypothetical protein
MLMRYTITALALLALAAGAGPALATEELRRVTTTIEVDENAVTLVRLLKLVEYTAGETLAIGLEFSGTCNLVFQDLALRPRNGFTPRAATGTLASVVGTPAAGAPDTAGVVNLELTFDTLRKAGGKEHGKAHLTLLLGVDSDCDPATGDEDGVDDTLKIPVKVSVSTADHP